MDTGIFNNDEYFDVFVEYAKQSTDDILIKITVHNRSKEAASFKSTANHCGSVIPGIGDTIIINHNYQQMQTMPFEIEHKDLEQKIG
jgi:hypothetical protein